MPAPWVEPVAEPKGHLKPYLLLALTVSVLLFSWTLMLR
jgi:hypothetical protein